MMRFLACLAFFYCVSAMAHQPSESYLKLNVEADAVTGQWSIAIRDLDYAIGLDGDGNGEITWGELRSREAGIKAYALAYLGITANQMPCRTAATDFLVDQLSDGAYVVLGIAAQCASQQKISLSYSLFFSLDPSHRALLNVNKGERSAVLTPKKMAYEFDGDAAPNPVLDYGRHGVWHIWLGFDHLLFLLTLVLPAVLIYRRPTWIPAPDVRVAGWDLIKTVTAFTIAHSITLGLAVFDLVQVPVRVVEPLIAFSIAVTSINNLYPILPLRRSRIAFGFGLIHGLGFASVLTDLGLVQSQKAVALLGFNLGVELGQVIAVLPIFAFAYLLRATAIYRWVIFRGGSLAAAVVALIWFVERVFDLKLLGL